jgi:hypothetical protein
MPERWLVLYLLYTSDLPNLENNTVATFAEDTAILAVESSNEEATEKPQIAIDQMQKWTKKWRIHLNTLRTGDEFSRLWSFFFLYNFERQMTQTCLLTRAWILRT